MGFGVRMAFQILFRQITLFGKIKSRFVTFWMGFECGIWRPQKPIFKSPLNMHYLQNSKERFQKGQIRPPAPPPLPPINTATSNHHHHSCRHHPSPSPPPHLNYHHHQPISRGLDYTDFRLGIICRDLPS